MNSKLAMSSLAWGLGLTALTMLVSYNFCLNGTARGLPFAVYCPVCEASFASVGAGGPGGIYVLDLVRLLGNVILWGGAALGVQTLFSRGTNRRGCLT